MGVSFEFVTAGRILFGCGCREQIGAIAKGIGTRLLVVTGPSNRHANWLGPLLESHGLSPTWLPVVGEPTIAAVEAGAVRAREAGSDAVLGIGGGSVLDAAKAIAALAMQPQRAIEYLEVIGSGKPLDMSPLPCLAMPTTAGTGAEVTKNAVLGSPEQRVKVSLRHPAMLPRVAVIDPELTLSLPREATAATGLDALTQLIEPFVSPRATPLTDGFCREGLARIREALPAVLRDPSDLAARESMSLASLLGGLALANAGLGGVHGLAGPLGGMLPAPHGLLCGILLPGVMEANIAALSRSGRPSALDRYGELARLLTGRSEAEPTAATAWVRQIVATADLPRLATFGLTPEDIPEAVEKAQRASSMKANPVPLTDEALTAILREAC